MLIAQNTSKVPKHNYTYAPLKAKAGELISWDFAEVGWHSFWTAFLARVGGRPTVPYLLAGAEPLCHIWAQLLQTKRPAKISCLSKKQGKLWKLPLYIYIQYTYVWYFHILLCYFLRFFGFLLAEKLHTVSTVAPTILVRSSVLQTWPSVRDPILRADEGRLDPWI